MFLFSQGKRGVSLIATSRHLPEGRNKDGAPVVFKGNETRPQTSFPHKIHSQLYKKDLKFADISENKMMETQEKKSPPPLPLTNSDAQIKIYSVLPVFGLINMIISSATTIYRAYNKGDAAMIVFTSLVFVGTFLLDYWFRLYRELSPSEKSWERHMLKTGIWTMISAIMLGFAYEFSRFVSVVASVSLFGVVLSGNALLFYLYFIWDGEGKYTHTQSQDSCCVGGEEENKQFLLTVDKV